MNKGSLHGSTPIVKQFSVEKNLSRQNRASEEFFCNRNADMCFLNKLMMMMMMMMMTHDLFAVASGLVGVDIELTDLTR